MQTRSEPHHMTVSTHWIGAGLLSKLSCCHRQTFCLWKPIASPPGLLWLLAYIDALPSNWTCYHCLKVHYFSSCSCTSAETCPVLAHIMNVIPALNLPSPSTLVKIALFIKSALRYKNDILLAQPSNCPPSVHLLLQIFSPHLSWACWLNHVSWMSRMFLGCGSIFAMRYGSMMSMNNQLKMCWRTRRWTTWHMVCLQTTPLGLC